MRHSSSIRSAAPSPTVSTQQQFKQPKSGLQTAANVIGGGLATADNFGAFNKANAEGGIINFDQGGIANFHQGGLAEHRMADHSLPEHDPGVIDQIIRVLQEQGHLVKGPNGRMEFGIRMLNDPSFKPLYKQALTGVVEGSGYLPPMLDTETVVEEARVEQRPQSRETGRSDFDALVDTHVQLAKGFTDVQQPESKSAQEQPRGYGLLGSGDKPRGTITEKRALERLAAQERVSDIEAVALASAKEETGVQKSRPLGYGLLGSGEKPRSKLSGTRPKDRDGPFLN